MCQDEMFPKSPGERRNREEGPTCWMNAIVVSWWIRKSLDPRCEEKKPDLDCVLLYLRRSGTTRLAG